MRGDGSCGGNGVENCGALEVTPGEGEIGTCASMCVDSDCDDSSSVDGNGVDHCDTNIDGTDIDDSDEEDDKTGDDSLQFVAKRCNADIG